MGLLFAALLVGFGGSAWAADDDPVVTIRAAVTPDFRMVSGTISPATAPVAPSLLDELLVPTDDLRSLRTFPGEPNTGSEAIACKDALCTYAIELPRRLGDIGAVPHQAFRANGGWYPNIDGLSHVWDVRVALPDGAVGVLNGVVGTGSVAWAGTADRLSLAVFRPKTPVVVEQVAGGRVTFVGRSAVRKVARDAVRTLVQNEWPYNFPPDITVVESNDRHRLATSGQGVVYLSDRAFRVSPGLGRYHDAAVRRALYAAAPPFATTWDREFAGTALALGRRDPRVKGLLGWAAWNPVIDQLLHDGTLPFYNDVFDEAFPVATDPLMNQRGWRDPRAAALQLDDLLGEVTSARLVRIAMGAPTVAGEPNVAAPWPPSPLPPDVGPDAILGEIGTWKAVALPVDESPVLRAAYDLGVDEAVLRGWVFPAKMAPDYRVAVAPEGTTIMRQSVEAVGERIAEPVAEPDPETVAEPVVIEADGKRELWVPQSLEAESTLPVGTKQVVVDPDGHVLDADRSNNRFPAKWNVIATGWFDDLSATAGTFDVWADLVFRPAGDNRNLYLIGFEHGAQDIISTYLGYVRYLGNPITRSTREHRLVFTAGPALLDPAFRPTDEGSVALGGNVGYTWDTRPFAKIQIHGHRVSVATGGGGVPGSDERWASAGATYVQLLPAHPRHVFATRLRAAWASGDVEHRLLTLGGSDSLRSVPAPVWVGNERITGQLEYRAAVLRDVSLPLGFGWLSELVLVPGVEIGVAWRDGELAPAAATGVTAGVYLLVDVLGARPTLFGVSAGLPVAVATIPTNEAQIYISFDYAF